MERTSHADFGGKNEKRSYLIHRQEKLRQVRDRNIIEVGINGYFQILKKNPDQGNLPYVTEIAKDMVDRINEEEKDLQMENMRTMITTIVSFNKPVSKKEILLSEKLFRACNQDTRGEQDKMSKLRDNFHSQKDLVCIGKLVPNLIREQDNLLLEVMLPANLQDESKQKEAARLLAPFLVLSDNMVFNL